MENLFILIYFLVLLGIGLNKFWLTKSFRDFTVKFDDISVPALVCTIFASTIGAGSTIKLIENVYLFGFIIALKWLVLPLMWHLTSRIYTKIPERFANCNTLPEILGVAYGPAARSISAILSITIGLGSITAQSVALGFILEYFFKIPSLYGSIGCLALIGFYACLGGIRAIVLTEIFQAFIFFLALPIAYLYAFSSTSGGLAGVIAQIPQSHLTLSVSESYFLTGCMLIRALFPITDASFIQRLLMAKSERKIKAALRAVTLLSIPFTMTMVAIGYFLASYAPELEPKTALLFFIDHYLPIGLKALMIVGLLAIVMSMIESELNASGAIAVNDLIKPWLKTSSDVLELRLVRLVIVALSVIPMFMVSTTMPILDIIWLSYNFWEPILLAPIVAVFLGVKASQRTFWVSILTGAVVTLIAGFTIGKFSVGSIVIGATFNTLAFAVSHLLQNPVKLKLPTIDFANWAKTFMKIAAPSALSGRAITSYAAFIMVFDFIYTIFLFGSDYPDASCWVLASSYAITGIILIREAIFSAKVQNKIMPYFAYAAMLLCSPVAATLFLMSAQHLAPALAAVFLLISVFLFTEFRQAIFITAVGMGASLLLFEQTSAIAGPELILAMAIITISATIFLVLYRYFIKEKQFYQMVAAAIAHEIINPVAAMQMNSECIDEIMQSGTDYQQINEFTGNLKSLSQRTAELTNSVLRVFTPSKPSKALLVSELVNASLGRFRASQRLPNLLSINIVDDFALALNQASFDIILHNLLRNTVKHAGANVKIEISTSGRQLIFKDFGKGISSEDIANIFEPNYSTSKTGFGIGLALATRIITKAGGQIHCFAHPGEHSTFIICF